MHADARRHHWILAAALLAALAAGGCAFSERAFPMRPGDVVRIEPTGPLTSLRTDTRTWVAHAADTLAPLLDEGDPPALATDALIGRDGTPVDVFAFYGVDPDRRQQLLGNWNGIKQTAQGAGKNRDIEDVPPDWPGFEQVWIPVGEGVQLSARLGLHHGPDGRVDRADCIVIQPGFFGDNNIQRTRDMSDAFLSQGFHVLALEFRGHGRTEARYPDVPYSFGVSEAADLLAVAEWLESQRYVHRTGLVGFSWGANTALLAGWWDARSPGDNDVGRQLAARMPPSDGRTHYRAGIVVFSPVLRFEDFMLRLEEPISYLADPVYAKLQSMCVQRAERKGYPDTSGSLAKLVENERARGRMNYPGAPEEGIAFLRLLPARPGDKSPKLAKIRVPVLVVQAANDPIGPAQEVAELAAATDNPNIAALILPQGGHVGVQAYSRAYFYSLLLNFFDAAAGPVAVDPNAPARTLAGEPPLLAPPPL